MYSYEIDNLIKSNNYKIKSVDYIKICNSDQIDHIKFSEGRYSIWSTDGYYWNINVYN